MAATAGKVALVTDNDALTLRRRLRRGAHGVSDFVGYGTAANDSEAAADAER